ncbi:MAG: LLM class flavin-dependent oxidoreductase [Pseudomonadota bacterium]
MDKLNIGVTAWRLAEQGQARDLAEQGKIAEQLGFHSFWLPENHFGDNRSIPAPLMLLAAVAASTSRLKLGSTSYLLPIRNPLAAAEEVAVLDRMSDGRVILGVGRGVQDTLFRAFEINTKDKRRIFGENLSLMIAAWRGEPVAHQEDGTPVYLSPVVVQQPHPPVWVAAFGPLALKQAGRLGLPYLASPVETLAKLVSNYAQHRDHVAEAGLPLPESVPVMRTLLISQRPSLVRSARARVAAENGHAMRDSDAGIDAWTIIGDPVFARDRIQEYTERLGMTHLIARGRIAGVEYSDAIGSLEHLAKLDLSVSLRS